jgi:hypothetical protein
VTISLDDDTRTRGSVQKPGDFLRAWEDGPPLITDPAGTLVKSGPRKGLPVLHQYGRASGALSIIEDRYNLEKWAQRQIAYGIGVDPHAVVPLCADLLAHERDSQQWKEAADKAVVTALKVSKHMLAADRGTHVHSLTEDIDTGGHWLTRAEAGELLGIGRDAQGAIVDAWRQMLDAHGFEVVATEEHVVHDGYRLAGTLDRIVRLGQPFTFGDVEIPAGECVVLDIKSGALKVDKGYWHSYAGQIAAYADGVPYDVEAGERGHRVFTVRQDWALIAHLPVADVIAGQDACVSLIPVDLAAGRHALDLARLAKEWAKRRDIFGPTLPSVRIATSQSPADTLRARLAALTAEQATRVRAAVAVAGLPKLAECTPDQLERYGAAVADAMRDTGGPWQPEEFTTAPPEAPTLPVEPRTTWQRPDDGGLLGADTNAAYERMALALAPGVVIWVQARLAESVADGRAIRQGPRTVRTLEIVRAAVALRTATDDDDLIRHLLAAALGTDLALQPTVSLGMAFGSLRIYEARLLADAAERMAGGAAVLGFEDAGAPVLVGVAG